MKIPPLAFNYHVDTNTFLILYITLNSISMTRTTVDNYINAYGLFRDVWAPLVEAVLNIGFSILLGYYFKLNGVIIGIFISQFIIISLWKPYFLFKQGMFISPKKYFIPILYRYIIIVVLFIVSYYIFRPLNLGLITSVKDFIIKAMIVGISNFIIVSCVFYIFFQGTKDFVRRLRDIMSNKI